VRLGPFFGSDTKGVDGLRCRPAFCGRVRGHVEHDEIVYHAITLDGRDPNACVRQVPGVGLAFDTRYIVLVDDGERAGRPAS
jgi:hypothetical protein